MATITLTQEEREQIAGKVMEMTDDAIQLELDNRLAKITETVDIDPKINDKELLIYMRCIEAEQIKNKDMLKELIIKVDPKTDEVSIDYSMQPPKFQRIRRITGYLVGTVERFNNAKRAEEHDRLKHTDEKGRSFRR